MPVQVPHLPLPVLGGQAVTVTPRKGGSLRQESTYSCGRSFADVRNALTSRDVLKDVVLILPGVCMLWWVPLRSMYGLTQAYHRCDRKLHP